MKIDVLYERKMRKGVKIEGVYELKRRKIVKIEVAV